MNWKQHQFQHCRCRNEVDHGRDQMRQLFYTECVSPERCPSHPSVVSVFDSWGCRLTTSQHTLMITHFHLARRGQCHRLAGNGSQACPQQCISLAVAAVHCLTAPTGEDKSSPLVRQQQSRAGRRSHVMQNSPVQWNNTPLQRTTHHTPATHTHGEKCFLDFSLHVH